MKKHRFSVSLSAITVLSVTAAAAAAWGYQPLEMLLPYHPEFIVRRPEQLLTIF